MAKLPTRLVQRSAEPLADVEPLTLPIYETTTFLFESADEVRRYQEGKVKKYLYSRYANPTVVATEQKPATPHQFYFWTSRDAPIGIGAIVRVEGEGRIIHGVITGVGFLGAGSILRQEGYVHGLTTAASIWMVAAIGTTVGVHAYGLAVVGTVLALVVLEGFRWVERFMSPGGDENS